MTPLAPAAALVDVPHPYDATKALRASLVPIGDGEYGLYPWGGWFRQASISGASSIVARGTLPELRDLLALRLPANELARAGRKTLRL